MLPFLCQELLPAPWSMWMESVHLEIINSQLKVWFDLSYTGRYKVQEQMEIQMWKSSYSEHNRVLRMSELKEFTTYLA